MSLIAVPRLEVQLGGVWTDLVALRKVRHIAARRGRRGELEHFTAGELDVVLDNRDRRFDPTNTASPYYPNIKPNVPIRLRVDYGGTTYDRWFGYVDDWPQEWRQPHDALVKVTAHDGFKRLALTPLLSFVKHEILADTPVAAYMLEEPDRSESAADLTNTYPASPIRYSKGPKGGTYTLGDDALPADRTATALSLVPHKSLVLGVYLHDGGYVVDVANGGLGPTVPPTAGMTVECAFRTTSTTDTNTMFAQYDRKGAYHSTLQITQGGLVWFHGVGSNTSYNDGLWHHAAGVLEADRRTIRTYVDGVQTATWLLAADQALSFTPTGALIGGLTSPAFGEASKCFDGSLAAFAMYDYPLGAARIAAHAQAVRTGFAGERSGARVNRILDYAGWDAGLREIDAGSSLVGAQELGRSALDALHQVVDTEAGALYMGRAGKVRMRERHALLTQPVHTTVQAVFGDADGELKYAEDGLRVGYGDDDLRNDAVAARVGGVTQRAVDQASIGTYGVHRYESPGELIAVTDAEMFDRVNHIVSRFGQPQARVPDLTVKPHRAPASLMPALLVLELGHRIAVRRTTPGGGPRISLEVLVDAEADIFTPELWERAHLSVSPALPRAYALWRESGATSTKTWKADSASSTFVWAY